MAPEAVELDALTPTATLGLLEELARRIDLRRTGLRLRRQSGPEPRWHPVLAQRSSHQELFQDLRAVLEPKIGRLRRPARVRQNAAIYDLEPALPCVLLDSCGDGHEAHSPAEGEWLVVAQGLSPERRVALLGGLRFHTTDLRIADASSPISTEPFLLVHVRDQAQRGSAFSSLWAGGDLQGVAVLAAYRDGTDSGEGPAIFLPHSVPPPAAEALAAFRELLLRFATDPPPPAAAATDRPFEKRLAAILTQSTPERQLKVRLLPLEHLDFFDPTAVLPRPEGYAGLEIHRLQSSRAALDQLRHQVESRRDCLVGHRVELRQAEAVENFDQTLADLRQEIGLLQQRYQHLAASQGPGPVLYRYDQRCLPALADAIRTLGTGRLEEMGVSYAFQAVEDEAAGWHYLLCEPPSTPEEEHPWWLWQQRLATVDNVCFHQDPLWSRDYDRGGCAYQVFVPDGTRLFPSLHSWRRHDIDDHLRQLLEGRWFPRQEGVTVPSRGLCLFDGEVGRHQPLRVYVLDRDGFTPLDQQISWLNDNLFLQRDLPEMRTWIGELAGQQRDRHITGQLYHEAQQAQSRFSEVATTTERRIAHQARQRVDDIHRALDDLDQQCRELRGQIRAGHHQAKRASRVARDASRKKQRFGDGLERLQQTQTDADVEIERLRQRIEAGREEIKTLRAEAERAIEALWQAYYQARQNL